MRAYEKNFFPPPRRKESIVFFSQKHCFLYSKT